MNINPKKFKYVNISQHWSSRKGKEYQGKFIYVNPLIDEGKSRIAYMSDLLTLIEFHKWTEGNQYSFSDSPSPEWGCELYEINNNELKFIKANYDTSD